MSTPSVLQNASDRRRSSSPRLRSDLKTIASPASRGMRIMVADEVAGKFVRVSSRLWQSLATGTADASAWNLAHSAGWTMARSRGSREPSENHWNPLFIRIPLVAIDTVAGWMAQHSSFLFSKKAVRLWSIFMLITIVLLCSQSFEIINAFAALPQFFAQASPLVLGITIAATKIAHELAHATVCKREGANCGVIGVILMCGIPCPYCDVTDSYRLTYSKQRAAVMMAGIYAEWVIACLAAWVFVLAKSHITQMHALNVMIICGVSTFVFNANPLMRYDGYYLLSDWLGSVGLRQESKMAFVRGLSGSLRSLPRREKMLAVFHVLSTTYRLAVMAAITVFMLSIFEWLQIAWAGKWIVAAVVLLLLRRLFMKGYQVLTGTHEWSMLQPSKRYAFGCCTLCFIVFLLCYPLPRRASVVGHLDAVEAKDVHLNASGVVQQIHCDFGNIVAEGQPLVTVSNPQVLVEQIKWRHEVGIAALRSRKVRESSIGSASSSTGSHEVNDPVRQWKTMEAAEAAARESLSAAHRGAEHAISVAPIAGVVLPPKDEPPQHETSPFSLDWRVGQRSAPGGIWCRIAPSSKLSAVLQVDAVHRKSLSEGTSVRIEIESLVIDAVVDSISNIRSTPDSLEHDAVFEVVCSIPENEKLGGPSTANQQEQAFRMISFLGQSCRGAIELPNQSLAEVAMNRLEIWLRSFDG